MTFIEVTGLRGRKVLAEQGGPVTVPLSMVMTHRQPDWLPGSTTCTMKEQDQELLSSHVALAPRS